MMPGETHSKTAGIASEAAGSCQNCTSLQQSLNEYVAALIALKQKIIGSDQLLAEYQQKCDDLQDAERENETLRCQLEQMLKKISLQEQHEEELKSLKAELEEKRSTVKIYQQTQIEYIRVKEECEKSDNAKKKLEAKLKKMEESAAKHDKDYKQLKLEKKVIGKELKKIQKKLDRSPSEKSKKVLMKNAQTQVAREEAVVKLDKQKIRNLLEEIWGCIESSTENGDCRLLMLGNIEKYQLTVPEVTVKENKRQRKNKSSPKCKQSSWHQTFNPHTELGTVQASLYLTKPSNFSYTESSEDTALNVLVSKDLGDCSSESSDLENDLNEMLEVQDWAKPLPNLLSPIQCSPLTRLENVFGEYTDSSDDDSFSEMDQSKCVSQPKIEIQLDKGTDKTSNLEDEVEHLLIAKDDLSLKTTMCSNDAPDLTTEKATNMHDFKHSIHMTPLQEAQAVSEDPIHKEDEDRSQLTNSTTSSKESLMDSLNGPGPKLQSPESCGMPLVENEDAPMSPDAESEIQDTDFHTEKDKLPLDITTSSCSPSRNLTEPNESLYKIKSDDLTGNDESLECVVADQSPITDDTIVCNDLNKESSVLISVHKPTDPTLDCGQKTVFHMASENSSENANFLNDLNGKQDISDDSSTFSKNTKWQNNVQNSVDLDLSNFREEILGKTYDPTIALSVINKCTEETDQPCASSPEKGPESVLQPFEQSQASEPLRKTPPVCSISNDVSADCTPNGIDCEDVKNSVYDKGRAIDKPLETHLNIVADTTDGHSTMAIHLTSMESQFKTIDKEENGLEKMSSQNEIIKVHQPEEQKHCDLEMNNMDSTAVFHNEDGQNKGSTSEISDHSFTVLGLNVPLSSSVGPKTVTELQSSQLDTCNGDSAYSSNMVISDGPLSPSCTVYSNDKCMPCLDKDITETRSTKLDKPIHEDFSTSSVDMAVDSGHKSVGNVIQSQHQEGAHRVDSGMKLNSSITQLQKIGRRKISAVLLPLVPLVEFQPLQKTSESKDDFKKSEEQSTDACNESLDSSESDYEFPVRKVNFTRPVLNKPFGRNESFKTASSGPKGENDNELEEQHKPANDCDKYVDKVVKPSTRSSDVENDTLGYPEHSTLHSLDTDVKTIVASEENAVDNCCDGKPKDHSSLAQPARPNNVSDSVHSSKDAEKNISSNAETGDKRILPGKNLIWNFSRSDDFVDPRAVFLTRKQKTESESVCTNAEDSVRNCLSTGKAHDDDIPKKLKSSPIQTIQRLPQDETTSSNAQAGEIILANADTSTSTGLSPEMITQVRSEMGPPLPPLLGPLLSTPPRSACRLSPIMTSLTSSLLPSPIEEFVSPLPGTPIPPLMSPLSGRKRKSPVFNTPSPAEKANRRILSSPLQFCAATPKHAVPVPGRLPLSANGSSACNVQENSVKILDTMYPELSARARTLNILKGNVHLNRGIPGDGQNVPVSQISGFKSITSTSTVFIKTGSSSKTSNKEKPNTCETQLPSETCTSVTKRAFDSFQMPKSAKRLRLDSESPVAGSVKVSLTTPVNSPDAQKVLESSESFSYCESLPDIVKGNSVDEDIISNALKKVEELCFDLLPVIRSHVFVGAIPNVPVMRNEEKEVIHDFSSSKKGLADSFLHVLLKKIKAGKKSLDSAYLQALCRVYVGLCRQLGDIERARVLCYSILKEDFPDPDKLFLFVISSWKDLLSLHGVVSKAMQAILKILTKDDVGSCLSAYLNWKTSPPMTINVLLNSVLMAIQLYPDVKFQQSEKYGEDLTDNVWEYVFAVDLLCSYRKWNWTHENVISKELWPVLDKWVKRKKGNLSFQFVPDITVATVLRLIGYLCQKGLKEGSVTAVKNISSVIIAFISHANEEGVPWGVQLASVYMLCDTAPCDPAVIHQTLQSWKETTKTSIPPAVTNRMQEIASMCAAEK